MYQNGLPAPNIQSENQFKLPLINGKWLLETKTRNTSSENSLFDNVLVPVHILLFCTVLCVI
jgi:hypothetical protein